MAKIKARKTLYQISPNQFDVFFFCATPKYSFHRSFIVCECVCVYVCCSLSAMNDLYVKQPSASIIFIGFIDENVKHDFVHRTITIASL